MLVARDKEKKLLEDAFEAEESQFIAVFGRRRVGKTYLVRETFEKEFTFQHTSYANTGTKGQLFAFSASLREYGLQDFSAPANWLEAFELLKDLIRNSSKNRKVIFIDELSWMDSGRSDLMPALEGFWNGWASARKDIVLIVCGSATSWMLSKVVHNKGGLYNRLTAQINLMPFTLAECAKYAASRGIVMNHHQLLECYMVMGGVPYYWSFLRKELSLSQNIDLVFFGKNAPLKDEFRYLFRSLFKRPEGYVAIIEALGTRKAGMERTELLAATGLTNSGGFTSKLEELEQCGFIRKYREYGKAKKNAVYQLIDNFTLFHYRFLEKHPTDEHYWSNQENTPARNTWTGIAFERVCLQHIREMKKALGISGVLTDVSSWSCTADCELGINGSQIDLIIDRKDQVINLCEMKYSTQEYSITQKVDANVRHKVNDFRFVTGTKSAIHVTFVTPYGLARNSYAGNVQSEVTADDFFA
ncbi:MAG: ATP-binding protein [Atopobiaceae bacterium]|nr:ATP-binding protein [Atopobiaceae bacterium]